MDKFYNLKRNVTFWEGYDENSFIGKWVDDGIWSDSEYWKLELDLIKVKEKYPYPSNIPREITAGIFRIIELLIIPNWEQFEIEASPWLSDEVTIYERYERFKVMIRYLFTGEELDSRIFDYVYEK